VKIVDRLILKEMLGPVANSFFMFLMLVYTTTWLVRMTDWMVKGASMSLVVRSAVYSLPALATQCLPMALLLGTLLAFGRLSGDSENIALHAGGVSFWRVAKPVGVLGIVIAVITFTWNDTLVPWAQTQFLGLQREVMESLGSTNQPISYAVPRREGKGVDEWINIAGGYDAKSRSLLNVTILKMSEERERVGRPEVLVYAERVQARLAGGPMTDAVFMDGYVRYLRPDANGKIIDVNFELAESRSLPQNVGFGGRDFKRIIETGATDKWSMTFARMREKIQRDHQDGNFDTGVDEFNMWEKIWLPLASCIFGLVGAPLGVRPHRGNKTLGFGLAIVIIFLYWVTHNWMFQLAKGGAFSPMLAACTANIVGAIAAAVLMARTRQ
jgi:lipopolysaccharide export system permease protein